MFTEQCLSNFDPIHEPYQSQFFYKQEINCTTWNVFGLDEPELVDCQDYPDRKSTGIGIEIESVDQDYFRHDCKQQVKQEEEYSHQFKISHKNETKNIPKNYGKATILYIRSNKSRVNKLLQRLHLDESQFNDFINYSRCHINTIKEIRNFWTDQKFGKAVRILSFQFMRKHSLNYIFNSRIKNYITHVKYRSKLIDGLRTPESFVNIKDF